MNAPAAYLPRATTADHRLSPPRAYGRYAIAVRLRDLVVRLVRQAAGDRRDVRLLDLGCGDMPYRPLIAPLCAAYDGADLPGNAAATYHLRPDGTTTADAGAFDLVLSTQVLEHVRDVPGYLAEARRLLAPAGRLVLTTHGTWVYHADPHDYWRWTAEGLRAALSDAGFRVTHLTGVLGLMPMGLQLFQDGLVRKLPRPLRKPLCFAVQQVVLVADRLHSESDRARDACVFGLIAEPDTSGKGS